AAMSKELLCPVCGTRLPLDPKDQPPGSPPAADPGRTIEAVIPSTQSLDDIRAKVSGGGSVVLAWPEGDGVGVFVAGDANPQPEPSEPAAMSPIDGPAVWLAESSSGSAEAITALSPGVS